MSSPLHIRRAQPRLTDEVILRMTPTERIKSIATRTGANEREVAQLTRIGARSVLFALQDHEMPMSMDEWRKYRGFSQPAMKSREVIVRLGFVATEGSALVRRT